MAELRVRDLNRLLQARHGYKLPDNAQGRQFAHVMIQHLVRLAGTKPLEHVQSWCELYAPWLPFGDVAVLIGEAAHTPKYWKAGPLGWHLKVTTAERRAWRITTIAAYDRVETDEKASRKLRKAEAERKRRRKHGAKPRSAYIASVNKGRPWIALGISRAAYYRRQKKRATRD